MAAEGHPTHLHLPYPKRKRNPATAAENEEDKLGNFAHYMRAFAHYMRARRVMGKLLPHREERLNAINFIWDLSEVGYSPRNCHAKYSSRFPVAD